MRLGKTQAIAGGAILALATAAGVAAAQQQAVPNAPTPQTLPKLNTITPVGPAVPGAAPSSAAPGPNTLPPQNLSNDNMGGPPPSSTLPTAAQQSAEEQKQEKEAPLPANTGGPKYVLRQNVTFVQVPVTVKDSHGNLVPGLDWRYFRIYENGVRQRMSVFEEGGVALSVALVIDQGVTFDTMDKINASLSALQGAFSKYDEVAVFTYSNGVKRQTGFTAAQSARLGVILQRSKGKGREPLMPLGGPLSQTTEINNHGVDPNTDAGHGMTTFEAPPREFHTLNDAILAAAEETATAPRDRRRIVYVISDGKEYGSKASEKEVIRYLQTNHVSVYATVVGDSSIPGMGFLDRIHLPLTMRDNALPRYAAETGGQIDPEFRPRGIENSFANITKTVRNQYTIGYYSHQPPLDSKFRSIEVRVLEPDLTVIAEPGYYPSARDSAPSRPTVPTATP